MGIRASATCTMQFDGRQGWLVGAPAPGHGRDVHDDERRPPRRRPAGAGRRGGRLPGGPGLRPGAAAGPLTGRRACARPRRPTRSSSTPTCAGTCSPSRPSPRVPGPWPTGSASSSTVPSATPIPAERQAADDLAALMTPIIKAFLTDHGFAATNLAMQVFGGHGYIRETGVEQYVRDARIAQIYEGANGIQALDLVGRKLGQHTAACSDASSIRWRPASRKPRTTRPRRPRAAAGQGLRPAAAGHRPDRPAGAGRPRGGGAAATDYLQLFGHVALGYMWLRMAKLAQDRLPAADADADFYDGQADDGAVLHAAHAAAGQRTLPGAERGQGQPDGAGARAF